MSDFDILRAMLTDAALARVEQRQDDRKNIVLDEQHAEQPYGLRITGAPYDTVAFRADSFPAPRDLFRCGNGECKRADYVIISRDDDENWIIYVEMKSGSTGSREEIVQQLRGAQCIVAYCRAVGREFWGEDRFLQSRAFRERFVSVRNVGQPRKRPSEPPSVPVNDRPEHMKTFSDPPRGGLRFKQLFEGKRRRS